jgi:hypothetical protein
MHFQLILISFNYFLEIPPTGAKIREDIKSINMSFYINQELPLSKLLVDI